MKYIILVLCAVIIGLILSFTFSTVHVVNAQEILFTTVRAEVTAYTASADETDASPSVTASGEKVRIGGVACPRNIQFGTQISVNDKIYTCNDRMNARYTGQNYDILVASKLEAKQFGRQFITIKIYE